MKNISNDTTLPIAPCLVSANQVAHQLLINSRGILINKPKRPVLSPTVEESMAYPFSEEAYRRGIATLKNNKAAGIDDVLVEQLNNVGPKTHKWIIAILKPGKDSATPKSYRPISFLCNTYKRFILNRKAPTMEEHLIKEQTCFRSGKTCTSQLDNLTQHIVNGYQV